jgi:DNA (cytosine-5)-methyltransferase 3A
MKVLSLFDGISCGQIALERAGIVVDEYYASEIKDFAMAVTMHNYPNTIQIGDVTKVSYKNGVLYTEKGEFCVGTIDLLIGGSPCQDFSFANMYKEDKENTYGLNGSKSSLFYEFLRLKEEISPKYFLLENVKMRAKSETELNEFLGVEGIHIDSRLVSFQTRARIYWTNIPNVTIPVDKNISFQDYKDTDYERCKEAKMNRTPSRERMWNNGNGGKLGSCKNVTYAQKVGCITRKQDRCPNSGLIEFEDFARFLTRREIEQAQTLPYGYTDILSYNQMQDVCGDGWTVDVIAHIFKGLR